MSELNFKGKEFVYNHHLTVPHRPGRTKEWLMTVGGLDEVEIAVKTADTNDLATPENQDLLAPTNRVQVSSPSCS